MGAGAAEAVEDAKLRMLICKGDLVTVALHKKCTSANAIRSLLLVRGNSFLSNLGEDVEVDLRV